jgi:hypothetical protein
MAGHYSDRPLTIPDSKSAMDNANSPKETNRTRHIARRFHYVGHCVGNGTVTLFKVQGTNNTANYLTKPLAAQHLQLEAILFQVEVDPALLLLQGGLSESNRHVCIRTDDCETLP